MRTSKGGALAALGLGLALIAAACGSSSSGSTTTAAPGTTAAPTTTAAPATTTAGSLPAGVAMQITYEINPKAVWDDGSPITVADFECSWQAALKTPGSIGTVGYDQIT